MNPIHTPPLSHRSRPDLSPRLTCRVARLWCAVTGGGNSRHVAGCADCQEYFRHAASLETALRQDAARERRATTGDSPNLERDILRAVRQAAEPAPAERSIFGRAGWIAAGLGAAAAIAAFTVVTNRLPQSNESAGRTDQQMVDQGAAVIASTVGSLSDKLVDSVIPSAGELVAKNPLQDELGSVYSDMKSALDFLAMNFLPSSGAPPVSRSSG